MDTSREIEDLERQLKNNREKRNSYEYVDIDNIEFEKASVESQAKSINSIFGSKPSYQVVCSQSGYMAKISAMTYKDVVAIMNSNLSNLENKKEIYKTLYSKITGYSAEKWKPSYEEWLKITSLGDVETLFYGLYCSTFQEKSSIKFECPDPDCGGINVIEVDNAQLLRVEDSKEMSDLTKRIAKEADSEANIKEFSLVSDKKENKKNIRLPQSKIIFSLKLPTLYKVLEVLKTFSDEEIATKSVDQVNILLSTDKVAIPDLDTGKYSYVESLKDIPHIIDLLSLEDISVLKSVVNSMLDEKHITYCVKDVKCEHCGKTIKVLPLDMESLLFFQITEKQLL